MNLDGMRAIHATGRARSARAASVVVVVGPSGAGKSTLVAAVRAAGIEGVDVPTRWVTRPPRKGDLADDAVHISESELDERARDGTIAVHWQRVMDSGRTIRYGFAPARPGSLAVLSANSAILSPDAHLVPPNALANALVIAVQAPLEVCAVRLRSRSPDLDPEELAFRLAHDRDPVADLVVDNHGELEHVAPRELIALITQLVSQVR